MNNKKISIIFGVIIVVLLLILIFGPKKEVKNDNNSKVNNENTEKVEKTTKKVDIKKTKDNNKKEENKIYTTKSGLKYQILRLGKGKKPTSSTDMVEVDYQGTLEDGTEFDSSYKRGQKASFKLNQVIPGWTEGLQLMPIGSKFKFIIPPKLAYGTGEVCVPTSVLDKNRSKIPKENFLNKKCTLKDKKTNKEIKGELMKDPMAHKLAGKTLIFIVELYSINDNKDLNKK